MGVVIGFSFSTFSRIHIVFIIRSHTEREHIFKLAKEDKVGLEMIVDEQLEALKKQDFSKGNHQIVKFKEMVQMLLYNNAAFLTTDNDLTIYTDGHQKFDDLINDIRHAQSYITSNTTLFIVIISESNCYMN